MEGKKVKEPKLINKTYELVDNPKDADAAAWGFLKPGADPSIIYYKFLPLGDDEVRIAVEWTGLC